MLVVNSSNLPLIDYRKLKPLQGNLKDLSEKNYKRLLKSIEDEGFFIPAFVWFDGDTPYILDAHQRQRVLITEKIKFDNTGYEIPYLTIEAKDKKDAATKLLKISSQYGTITQEGIDEFIAKYELVEADVYEATSFDAITSYADEETIEDSPYTGKVESPVYEVQGENPDLLELYDRTKYEQLADEILNSNLPKEVEDFLLKSATRHIVFNYAKIAEYYANSSPQVQQLMEDSALVIIDFEQAIEKGFVKLSEDIAESFKNDNA